MPFQSRITTVPDLATFMTALCDFAVANGSFSNVTTTPDGIRIISRGGIFWAFHILSPVISGSLTITPMEVRMTYVAPTSNSDFGTVAGQYSPSWFAPWAQVGPFTSYYIYQTDHAIHGVLEVFPNVFSHFSFGVINKSHTFIGGEYISTQGMWYNSYSSSFTPPYILYGSHPNNQFPFDGGVSQFSSNVANTFPNSHPGYVRHAVGGAANNSNDFQPISGLSHLNRKAIMVIGEGPTHTIISIFGRNAHNSRSIMSPVYVQSADPLNNSVSYLLGEVPGAGYLRVDSIPEGEFVDLVWQAFPVVSKTNPSDRSVYQSPGAGLGIAYLRA